ncbi:MAG TPA: FecR family protein [Chitinophagaceae bacterium]|jgi:ferric-dicitrate binding protein FerR (iron transport regulator)|nr:FecR family protein [Chitinophagaceae bacterium]
MEYPEHIWVLMSRNLSGEATPQENEELMQMLQQQPQLMQQYDLLKSLWNAKENKKEIEIGTGKISHILQLSAVEDALKEDNDISAASAVIYRRRKIFRWAAILIGISVFAWALTKWIFSSRPSSSYEIVAQKGSRTRTILPDGSTVWVNAGSKIIYEPNFNARNREITLYGEAYFDVVKESGRPFIVHTGHINIKVLGTVFNVKSYPEDKTIETTLIKGLVQITTANTKQAPIYLHPNQKIILPQLPADGDSKSQTSTADDGKLEKNTATTSAITNLDSSLKENELMETAWIYNRLEFRGDSFTELAKKLERWYNIAIHFEDEQVKKLTFNGSLENETITQAFHALQTANSFNFKIKDNEIFIRSLKEPE